MIIRHLEAIFSLKSNSAQFKKVSSQLDNLAQKTERIFNGIAGYFAAKFVLDSSKTVSELGRTAQFLGITTQALQEMHYAAKQSGVSVDTLEDSLKELQIRAVDALSGSGEAFEAFLKLGVQTRDDFGGIKKPLGLLDEVADKLSTLSSQSERIWVVDSIFGDEGAKMLRILNEGSLGLRRLREEAAKSGSIISSEQIQNAKKFNQELEQMKSILFHSFSVLVEHMTKLVSLFMRMSLALKENKNMWSALRTLVSAIGITLSMIAGSKILKLFKGFNTAALSTSLLTLGARISSLMPMIAIISSLALAVEDLWAAFEGKDSFIVSTTMRVMTWFSKTISSIKNKFSELISWLSNGALNFANKLRRLLPDFLKAKFKHVISADEPKQISQRVAASSKLTQQRFTQNQNIRIAVNVKSGPLSQNIGTQVAEAVRAQFDKEKFNTFMGVNAYVP